MTRERDTYIKDDAKMVDYLSAVSLYLSLASKGQHIGTATGFVVEWDNQVYLITNWHVVSGRHPDNNKPIAPCIPFPDELRVMHHAQKLGTWELRTEALYDAQGVTRWFEHPNGPQVDVIALPLENVDAQVKLYPLNSLLFDEDMVVKPAMTVSIIGFPLGLTSIRTFPIWKIGHIASGPDLDYQDLPAFLVDGTIRPGMSGSPVFRRIYEPYLVSSGAFRVREGGTATRFLGVYSSALAIHSDASDISRVGAWDIPEVGLVWRPEVIEEIVNQIAAADSQLDAPSPSNK